MDIRTLLQDYTLKFSFLDIFSYLCPLNMRNSANTYLVLRFQSLGNVAMMIPILASVAMENPEDEFVVVTNERLQDLFFGLKNVNCLSLDSVSSLAKNKSVSRLYAEIKRDYAITHVVDLQNNSYSRMLDFRFRLAGKHVTILHKDRKAKRRLCRNGYAESAPLTTEFKRYADTFQRAGLKYVNHFTTMPVNTEAAAAINRSFGDKQGTWIAIAPFAKSKTNMLPYRITKEVIANCARRKNTRVFLFGAGKVECEMLNQWADLFDNVDNVAGKLSIAEELELMRKLDLMLCMDSANQHLASLVSLRCLSVWCGTHPIAGFYGWKQRQSDIIQQPLSCRPCTMHGRNRCRFRNFLCRNFTSAEITQRMEQILKE